MLTSWVAGGAGVAGRKWAKMADFGSIWKVVEGMGWSMVVVGCHWT